jgi:hypothetical protein
VQKCEYALHSKWAFAGACSSHFKYREYFEVPASFILASIQPFQGCFPSFAFTPNIVGGY